MEQRLRNILYRISVSNAGLCKKQSVQDGMLIRVAPSPLMPDLRSASIAAYNLGQYPKVGLIVPDSPAAAAGFRVGDEIISIDGNPLAGDLSTEMDAERWTASMTALKDAWELAGKSPPATVTLLREGRQQTLLLNSKTGCELNGFLRLSRDINAANAGTTIWATTGLFQSTSSDDEVAFVLAHEAAHSILGHAPQDSGMKTKDFAIRRTMEIEADRLGVQLMANAGYDPYAAARFHSRWNQVGRGFFEKLTGETFVRRYMKPKERIALLQRRAEELDPDRKLATQSENRN